MNTPTFTEQNERILLGLGIFGLLVPNGIFVWYFLTAREEVFSILMSPIGLVLMIEAFFLMSLGAWLVKKLGGQTKDSIMFVIMSITGSLFFSVPVALAIASKRRRAECLAKSL